MANTSRGKVAVWVPTVTNRLRYTFDLMLSDLVGLDYEFHQSLDSFEAFQGPKMSYGEKPIGDEIFINAVRLLFEKGIEDQQVSVFDWQGVKGLFSTNPNQLFPFDPFAASFWLVTRYEEYLPHLRDEHDRYDSTESLAYQKGFVHKPLVNIYAAMLREVFKSRFPDLVFSTRKYRFISTIDIDNAWAYLEKGFMRTAGAYARSIVNLDVKDFLDRTQVLLGLAKDPYDTYALQLELQRKYKFKSIYFFLLGEYGVNDKNVPVESRKFQSLIQSLSDYADAGIHPSYGSNKDSRRLRTELSHLGRILKREVHSSRQHFLVLKLPETYRRLIELDVTDEYSMGLNLQLGFRASICTPFFFYDLDNEQATTLRIHPFAVMDATMKYYMKIRPEQAMDHILPIIREVRAVNGDFISLWHNESLSENKIWQGWRDVYVKLVEAAV
ncbi:MAG: polysaccharide deacetylase family protein [Bacteroidota bacterium]